jgi:exodeoxyribonuclease-3
MKNIKIYSWNVNGIRAAVRNGFMDWFNKERPDILCMQETKAHDKDFPQEIKDLKDYKIYHSPAQKKGYAGVAILTKVEPIKIIDKIGIDKFDNEGRFLFLEFSDFYLFNTYFPHTQRELVRLDFKQEFNEAYLNFIKQFNDKPIILTGDFNVAHQAIDLKNPKQNERNAGFTTEERSFVDKLLGSGFVDTFRQMHPETVKYTWWSYRFHARERNIGWRVDYFFVPAAFSKNIKRAEALDDVYGSDHCPILVDIVY